MPWMGGIQREDGTPHHGWLRRPAHALTLRAMRCAHPCAMPWQAIASASCVPVCPSSDQDVDRCDGSCAPSPCTQCCPKCTRRLEPAVCNGIWDGSCGARGGRPQRHRSAVQPLREHRCVMLGAGRLWTLRACSAPCRVLRQNVLKRLALSGQGHVLRSGILGYISQHS